MLECVSVVYTLYLNLGMADIAILNNQSADTHLSFI